MFADIHFPEKATLVDDTSEGYLLMPVVIPVDVLYANTTSFLSEQMHLKKQAKPNLLTHSCFSAPWKTLAQLFDFAQSLSHFKVCNLENAHSFYQGRDLIPQRPLPKSWWCSDLVLGRSPCSRQNDQEPSVLYHYVGREETRVKKQTVLPSFTTPTFYESKCPRKDIQQANHI